MKEILFIGYVNGLHFLKDSLPCYLPYFDDIRIINNSLAPIDIPDYENVTIMDMPVSLNCYQTTNWARHVSIEEGMDLLWWSHHDMTLTPEKVVETKEGVYNLGLADWGVAFTRYDVFCAYNVLAWKDVGPYDDLRFKYYTGDVDMYARFEHNGWKIIELGQDGVWHRVSGVIREDADRDFVVQKFAEVERELYCHKWKNNKSMLERINMWDNPS